MGSTLGTGHVVGSAFFGTGGYAEGTQSWQSHCLGVLSWGLYLAYSICGLLGGQQGLSESLVSLCVPWPEGSPV